MTRCGSRLWMILVSSVMCLSALRCEPATAEPSGHSLIMPQSALDTLLQAPPCLEGYRPNQSGPLSKIDAPAGEQAESTFTVEPMKIPSEGLLINGWLYLPKSAGPFPLVVLTNGGGDDSRPIKSLSDWIAPILAHCGFAAFVHDKRGTGQSEGQFEETTYDDYVTDAGNCALFLSRRQDIDPNLIGVLGGSEGGRIAVLTASRYPAVTFAISFAGTVVSALDDRMNAQMGWLKSKGLSDSVLSEVVPLWDKSLRAWASHDPADHDSANRDIALMRKRFDPDILPCPKEEMERGPEFRAVLPTWRSLANDYVTELGRFDKKWLAIFGEVDPVVPTEASIRNIEHLMALSGNEECEVAVIPRCGHAPVDVETKSLIRIDNLVINWMNDRLTPR